MIHDLITIYFSLVFGIVLFALFAPTLNAWLLDGFKWVSDVFLAMATVALLLLLTQQLAIVVLSFWGVGQDLPLGPMTLALQVISGAPGPQGGTVHLTWWSEELRLNSAVVMIFAIMALGAKQGLLRANTKAGVKSKAVTDIVAGLLMAIPAGLIVTWFGWNTAFKSIVSRARNLDQLPPRTEWVWEGAASFIGFGHVWAFKALVPVIGVVVILVGSVMTLSAIHRLRANGAGT